MTRKRHARMHRASKGLAARVMVAVLMVGCGTPSSGTYQIGPAREAISTATPEPLPPTATPPLVFDGQVALRHAEAQMAFGPRPTGSDAAQRTAEYIVEKLEEAGWDTDEQTFEYHGVLGRNLIGRAARDDSPVVILGAHYDTRRVADNEPSDSPDVAVPGANDGASGVAVLLELARVLDQNLVRVEVWLAFFDAEDNGRLDGWEWIVGSNVFAEHLEVTPEYVIVVDMVGDANQQFYYEGYSDRVLMERLWKIAADLGYSDNFIPEIRHYMLDDHRPFVDREIPAVDIIDFDYPYWHTAQDSLDKISAASLERVGRVLETFLEAGGTYPDSSGQ